MLRLGLKSPRREIPTHHREKKKRKKFSCRIDIWRLHLEGLSVSAVKCISGTKHTVKNWTVKSQIKREN